MDLWSSLPRSLRDHQPRAAWYATLAAGLGVAACAFGGAYFLVDNGKLRVLMAALAGPLAALLVWFSFRARSAAEAGARALGLAVVFGAIVAGVGGLTLLASERSGSDWIGGAVVIMGFGAVFGAFFGFAYGIPLGVFVALVKRATLRGSHAADDRGVRASGIFLMLACGAAANVATSYLAAELAPSAVFAAYLLSAVGLAIAIAAEIRHLSRRRWLARARAGEIPGFHVRAPRPTDDRAALPVVDEGNAVLEWHPEPHVTTYRSAAQGTPLAMV